MMNSTRSLTADFTDQVVLVTGATAGIGKDCAQYFARAGAHVVCVGRSASEVDVAGLGGAGRHTAHAADVTSEKDVRSVVDLLWEQYGARLDVLVNNAGTNMPAWAVDVADDWDTVVDVNLTATFRMAQALAPLMLERGYGRVVNMASQAAVIALDRHVSYAAAKAGIVGLTRVLSREWAGRGVTVNAISPTVVDTELARRDWAGESGRRMRAAIPVGRFARCDEISGLVGYLASREAAMVTGQNIVIDGGYTVV